ncbi:hypothetical protein C8Q76DRAFT_314693 [Earliella scabrosa]|nr:hypothetical protein C8Q76DRAFT_314693 [Earliella scabrosa]
MVWRRFGTGCTRTNAHGLPRGRSDDDAPYIEVRSTADSMAGSVIARGAVEPKVLLSWSISVRGYLRPVRCKDISAALFTSAHAFRVLSYCSRSRPLLRLSVLNRHPPEPPHRSTVLHPRMIFAKVHQFVEHLAHGVRAHRSHQRRLGLVVILVRRGVCVLSTLPRPHHDPVLSTACRFFSGLLGPLPRLRRLALRHPRERVVRVPSRASRSRCRSSQPSPASRQRKTETPFSPRARKVCANPSRSEVVRDGLRVRHGWVERVVDAPRGDEPELVLVVRGWIASVIASVVCGHLQWARRGRTGGGPWQRCVIVPARAGREILDVRRDPDVVFFGVPAARCAAHKVVLRAKLMSTSRARTESGMLC